MCFLISCDQKSAFIPTTNFNSSASNKISIVFPKNQSIGIQNTLQVEWSSVMIDGTVYELQLSKTSSTLVKYASDIKTTKYTIENLESKQTYYWKIVGKNALGVYESDINTFSTGDFWVSAPLLTSPVAESINLPTAINFQWERSLSSESSDVMYDLYVGETPNPAFKVASNVKETNYTYSGLKSFVRYYWKVVAKNTSNNTAESKEIRSFTTIYIPTIVTINSSTLYYPENNATNVLTDVALVWSKTKASDNSKITYDVYMDNSVSPSSKIAGDIAFDANYFTVKNLLGTKKYFWKVVAKSSSGFANESATFNFTTISKIYPFTNVSPVDKTNPQPVNSTLTWNSTTSSDNSTVIYNVYLDPDVSNVLSSNATSKIANSLPSSATSVATPTLLGSKVYYWKVEAISSSGLKESSPVFTFTTDVTLTTSTLSSPSNGATGVSFLPTLTWTPAVTSNGETVYYNVYMDLSSNPATSVSTTTNTSFTVLQNLNPTQTYYWKIEASIPAGKVTTSSINSFVTAASLSNVTAISPANGAVGVSVLPTLTWNSVTATDGTAVSYDVYVGTSEGTMNKINTTSLTTTSFAYTNTYLAQGQTYYWKVIAKNNFGLSSPSSVSRFQTVLLSAPNYLVPNSSSVAQNFSPTLSWSAAAGGSGILYDVYMDVNANNVANFNQSTPIFSNLTGTSVALTWRLQAGTTYYWRVVAKNNERAGTSSSVGKFSVYTPATFNSVSMDLGNGNRGGSHIGILNPDQQSFSWFWWVVTVYAATVYWNANVNTTYGEFTYEYRYVHNVGGLSAEQIYQRLVSIPEEIVVLPNASSGSYYLDKSFIITNWEEKSRYYYIVRIKGPNGYMLDSPVKFFRKNHYLSSNSWETSDETITSW